MSSTIRIRTGEVFTKQEVCAVIGEVLLHKLVKHFDLIRCGSYRRPLYVGDDVIEAMKRHARNEKTT